MQKKQIKVVLTGGHAGSTAYALIEALRNSSEYSFQVFWIGAKFAAEGSSNTTFEHKVFSKIGVPFYGLTAGKLQTKFTFWTIPSILKIPIGFFQSLYYLVRLRPQVVVSFGGFAALPVVISAWINRIPVLIHEQTAAAGRANEIGSKFARKILLARESSLKYFPKNKCQVIGNPISLEIQSIKEKIRVSKTPTILVTGGSRGSILVNNSIRYILPEILKTYKVIHQTGELDIESAKEFKEKLPDSLAKNYVITAFIEPWKWKDLLNAADAVVGRAGANTVSEIVYAKIPSILIPLRIAYKSEQMENALFAKDYGIASIIEEKDVTGERLLSEIENIFNNWSKITSDVKNKKNPDAGASQRFVKIIENII